MGVCKLFFRIAHYLHENPHQLASASLEDIAAQYRPYAYIGARKHLREFVQEQAQEVGIDPAQWFGTKNGKVIRGLSLTLFSHANPTARWATEPCWS